MPMSLYWEMAQDRMIKREQEIRREKQRRNCSLLPEPLTPEEELRVLPLKPLTPEEEELRDQWNGQFIIATLAVCPLALLVATFLFFPNVLAFFNQSSLAGGANMLGYLTAFLSLPLWVIVCANRKRAMKKPEK